MKWISKYSTERKMIDIIDLKWSNNLITLSSFEINQQTKFFFKAI